VTALSRAAPAKLNLTLEILGKRSDGYHELRSVVTTVSLADKVSVSSGTGFSIRGATGFDQSRMALAPGELNTVERALALLREFVSSRSSDGEGSAWGARCSLDNVAISLTKGIPAAAGLGGGSSDAVAALLLLNEACATELDSEAISGLAAKIGSDCPFFVDGGVQAMSGRGDILQPLPPHRGAWFCVVTPSAVIPNKTSALYSRLMATDYTDGSRTAELAAKLLSSPQYHLQADDLCNDFDQYADDAYGSLADLRAGLTATGALAVHLCGAGASMYGLYDNREMSETAAESLRAEGYAAWAVSAPV
jgi:4-diphosphocytidyl-2-C-methyl-D-erythritol kinase